MTSSPVLVSYADDAPAPDAEVTAELGDLASVPANAPRASSSMEGTLVLDGGDDARAELAVRLRLDGYPATPDAAVSEVPGTVVLTYSAVARDGPVPSDGAHVDLYASACCRGRASVPNLDFAPDGVEVRTATYDLLTACVAGAPRAEFDFDLTLYQRQRGVRPSRFSTLTYRIRHAGAKSFAAAPFPPGVSVSIEAETGRSSPTTNLPLPSAVVPPSG